MKLSHSDYNFIDARSRSITDLLAVFSLLDRLISRVVPNIRRGEDKLFQAYLTVLQTYLNDDEYKALMRYLSGDVAEALVHGIKPEKPKRRKTDD